jgi:hypothetical protein
LFGVLHTPPDCDVVEEKLQGTDPIGTGIDPWVLDCHIKYIVAPKDLVKEV